MRLRVKKLPTIIFLVILSLMLLNCTAQATTSEDSEIITELPSMGGYLLRIILSMIFIVAITYLAMKLLRRQSNLMQRQKSWIKIYDYQGLGSNRGIYLLEILGSVYIMGISEGQFSILKEVDPNDEYWNDIKDDLENIREEIIPAGLKKWFSRDIGMYGRSTSSPVGSFENELDKQLDRSQRLFHRISRGGKDDE